MDLVYWINTVLESQKSRQKSYHHHFSGFTVFPGQIIVLKLPGKTGKIAEQNANCRAKVMTQLQGGRMQ